jgi:hypothetical protein
MRHPGDRSHSNDSIEQALKPVRHDRCGLGPSAALRIGRWRAAERRMLTTPQKRFVWARSERFADFSEFSFYHALVKRRRPRREQPMRFTHKPPFGSKRWKPAGWTPWLWVK